MDFGGKKKVKKKISVQLSFFFFFLKGDMAPFISSIFYHIIRINDASSQTNQKCAHRKESGWGWGKERSG
jgi:hypothetical protein